MIDALTLANDAGEIIPLGMLVVGAIWIVASYANSIARTKAREESRREIAAYVAEGTITPDDAVRLINAGESAAEAPRSQRA
ncbi:MAG: hypothetical protein IT432_02435 [Phycisphaerales bacterium]|nr:hypothetical protein [Phycisphaerales bacterium]